MSTPECAIDGCGKESAYLLGPEGDLCKGHAAERHPRVVGMLLQTLGEPEVGE